MNLFIIYNEEVGRQRLDYRHFVVFVKISSEVNNRFPIFKWQPFNWIVPLLIQLFT